MKLKVFILCLLSALLNSCGSSEESSEGSLSLSLTDAPVTNLEKVVVKISAVNIKGSDEAQNLTFEFNEPKVIDLLTLQGTQNLMLFENETVPAGDYTEIRLIVEQDEALDTYLEFENGGQVELTVPSGSQSGLKIKGSFNVPENGSANFTIDFDVLKSIVRAGNSGAYHLKPVLRLVDNAQVGLIKGIVDPTLINDPACSAEEADVVYVFSGLDITPDDIDVTENSVDAEPVTTALVELNSTTGDYEYTAAFLLAGDYTVSFTCLGDVEDVESDLDDLEFSLGQNVTVVSNEESVINF